ILQALDKVESVSKKATPSVIATGFGGSSMDLTVRWFIDNGTQANKVASIHQVIVEVKKALDAAGINIPFPIRTIDLSDPSVKSIVKQINKQQDDNVNDDDNSKKAETE
ncbi:MAG TPA: transporter, partial [Psychrobacter sp.]|nr:transporter [Psychrobacter sp.]